MNVIIIRFKDLAFVLTEGIIRKILILIIFVKSTLLFIKFLDDQFRVLLEENYTESDYINASTIPFDINSREIEYIAAQGPNETCLPDFWLMIWEQNISIIVMLTK